MGLAYISSRGASGRDICREEDDNRKPPSFWYFKEQVGGRRDISPLVELTSLVKERMVYCRREASFVSFRR